MRTSCSHRDLATLTTDTQASAEIARGDRAADQARAAGEAGVRSIRMTLVTQVMHSAALQRRVHSLRAANSRLHTSVGILEVQLKDRITPAPGPGKLLGFLPRPGCGPGGLFREKPEASSFAPVLRAYSGYDKAFPRS